MARTIEAIGAFDGQPPTLRISAGRGNGPKGSRAIHLAIRDSNSNLTHLLQAWFDEAELRAALDEVAPSPLPPSTPIARILSEPA